MIPMRMCGILHGMSKSLKIEVRCERDQKAEIKTAAQRIGQSVSTFMLTVALQAARASATGNAATAEE